MNAPVEKINIAIVGAGAVGCAVALELAGRGKKDIFIFERGKYLAEGQSGRNSGVIHAGLYYKEGSLKARLCVSGNLLLYEFCAKHDVPAVKTGKLVAATNQDEEGRVAALFERAKRNGADSVKLVGREEIKRLEPNIESSLALYSPSTGSVDAATYVKTLARLCEANGAQILMRSAVIGIEPKGGSFIVSVRRSDGKLESVEADVVINSAGLYSDKVAKMVDPKFSHALAPLRGEYFKFNKARRSNINMKGLNVYPAPEYVVADGVAVEVVGIHLTPTFGLTASGELGISNIVTVGPEFTAVTDREDYESNRKPASLFHEKAKRFFPNLLASDLEPDFTGIMANMGTGMDWLIEKCPAHPACVQLVGIDSPALTASLAIAKYVADIL